MTISVPSPVTSAPTCRSPPRSSASPPIIAMFSNTLIAVLERSAGPSRSEEHTSALQSLMRISYAVFCLKNKEHAHHQQDRAEEVHDIEPVQIGSTIV